MAPPPIARNKIEAAGIDWVLEQLEHGKGRSEIAAELGVSNGGLSEWLRADDDRSARVDAALIAGAEAYENQAVSVLRETYAKLEEAGTPHPHASPLASLAKELAQAAWRQAAVRDPRRYNSSRTEITGAGGGPLQVQAVPARALTSAELMQIAAAGQKAEE